MFFRYIQPLNTVFSALSDTIYSYILSLFSSPDDALILSVQPSSGSASKSISGSVMMDSRVVSATVWQA